MTIALEGSAVAMATVRQLLDALAPSPPSPLLFSHVFPWLSALSIFSALCVPSASGSWGAAPTSWTPKLPAPHLISHTGPRLASCPHRFRVGEPSAAPGGPPTGLSWGSSIWSSAHSKAHAFRVSPRVSLPTDELPRVHC